MASVFREPREARDAGPPPPPAKDPVKDRPTDAYLVVIHKSQRDYAEMIENRIKEFGILTDMVFLTDEKNLLPVRSHEIFAPRLLSLFPLSKD